MRCKIVSLPRKIRSQLSKVIIYHQKSIYFGDLFQSSKMVFEFCLAEFKAFRKRLITHPVCVDSECGKYTENLHDFACCCFIPSEYLEPSGNSPFLISYLLCPLGK